MNLYKSTSILFLSAAIGLLPACEQAAKSPETVEQIKTPQSQYSASVVRTSYGIPHITADNFGSLGFGEGYVAAQDHVCNIADSIVVARGERAKYHGAGEKNAHVFSDVVIRSLEIHDHAKEEFEQQSEENKEWITGYTAGYNKYVRETGSDNITSWCKGADWVKEITTQDLFARFQILAQTTPYMAAMIATAKPPEVLQPTPKVSDDSTAFEQAIESFKVKHLGSNGWAFGKDMTENGRGLLLGNPHYPWYGTSRFWEKHLTIPGKMNLYGSHLIGIPGVAIGFNENIGWTHTVSNSERVMFYKLDLVKGKPSQYYYDGETREMTAKELEIAVKGEDGSESMEKHTVWFSHYGPMINLPNVGWTAERAITIRDANYPNNSLFSQWKDMGLAKNMDEFKLAHEKWNAIPWVNTMATSKDGRAVFIDGSNVGRLSEDAIAQWRDETKSDPLTKSFYHKMGLILVDGSNSAFEWQAHPEARMPGVVPFVEQPQHDRTDYIFNANDSHWLTHVDEPLVGYSPLFGAEKSARSLRTRMNAKLLTDKSVDGALGEDGKFSLKEIQNALLSNRSLTAEILLDDLTEACIETTLVMVADVSVDLAGACSVLKGYNRKLDLDSKGAVLFREWITAYKPSEYTATGSLFAVPFDATDPVNTPRDLADKTIALQKLAGAVQVMNKAGLALDASLGEVQFAYRGDEKIAIHGGGSAEGIANIIGFRNYDAMAPKVLGKKIEGSAQLTDKGYPVTYGSSFILSLSYTDNGPVAEAFLTYSESGDPSSVHYADQTKLFSKKQWRPILFKVEDIDKDAQSSIVLSQDK